MMVSRMDLDSVGTLIADLGMPVAALATPRMSEAPDQSWAVACCLATR